MQHGDHHLWLNPAQIKPLAARQDRDWHFANLCCCEDELHVAGRFFQCFEQRIEGAARQHVHFVDDVDFEACRGGSIGDSVNHLCAHVIHACVGRGIHFNHIHMAPFGDGLTMLAHAAWFGGGVAGAIGANAIHALGDDAGCGGFAGAPDACHHEGLRNAIRFERIRERPDHIILADEIGKGGGPVFPGKHLVGGSIGHGWAFGTGIALPRVGRGVEEVHG